ncbi:hypothetical protein E0M35_29185 [Bacillus thuringiensis]|nr:hypothetical protein E0M35_29185 [Bacillus thuringiensis]
MIFPSYNENYVNELSIWTAHCIFCLAWFFFEMLAIPHAHQVKILLHPQNEIFKPFGNKKLSFIVFLGDLIS